MGIHFKMHLKCKYKYMSQYTVGNKKYAKCNKLQFVKNTVFNKIQEIYKN